MGIDRDNGVCMCARAIAEGGAYSHFLESSTDGDPIFSILGAFLFPTHCYYSISSVLFQNCKRLGLFKDNFCVLCKRSQHSLQVAECYLLGDKLYCVCSHI